MRDLIKVGAQLKEAWKQHNLTQIQLFNLTGVRPATISDLELGKHDVHFETLIRLAEGLNLNKIDLVQLLKLACQERKLSQKALSKLPGVKQASISDFETGKRSFKITNLFRLATVLNLNLEEKILVPEDLADVR